MIFSYVLLHERDERAIAYADIDGGRSRNRREYAGRRKGEAAESVRSIFSRTGPATDRRRRSGEHQEAMLEGTSALEANQRKAEEIRLKVFGIWLRSRETQHIERES